MEPATVSHPRGEFDAEYPSLFRELTRLGWALGLGNEDEDVAQEVLIDARLHLAQLRDYRLLRPWIRRIYVRAASRRRRRPSDGQLSDDLVYVPSDPSGGLDVREAVCRLPLRERQIVALVYGLGYTQPEVAEALGLTRGGVAKALFRARERIVRYCAEQVR